MQNYHTGGDQSLFRSHCRSDLFWLGSAVTCLGRARKGNGWTSNSRLPQRRSERSQQVFSHYSTLVRQTLSPSGSNNLAQAAARQTRTRLPAQLGERFIHCGHARPWLWGQMGNVQCLTPPQSPSNLFFHHWSAPKEHQVLKRTLGSCSGWKACNDVCLPMVGSVALSHSGMDACLLFDWCYCASYVFKLIYI